MLNSLRFRATLILVSLAVAPIILVGVIITLKDKNKFDCHPLVSFWMMLLRAGLPMRNS
jgi:hypothetical protein